MKAKFVILIALASLFILGGGVFFLSSTDSTAQVSPSPDAKAIVSARDFDWGKIKYDGPKATKVFTIKSAGTASLKVFNIKTSCHCTKAHLTIGGVDGPEFGMTGTSSWTGEIKPGKEARLVIVFDQSYHGAQGLGPVARYTSIETNDPSNSKIVFTTSGTVIK